jgi:DNA-binding transcriptional MerR regulator/methylmalonyl-CoA mutase cobalamin-binding subunit
MSDAAKHPIAVVAERTGLSQDVLRVWERRYGAVQPARGPGGQRVYSDADIQRLAMLHAATRAGRNIGRVVGLSNNDLAALIEEDLAAREQRLAGPRTLPDADEIITNSLRLARSLESARLDEGLRRSATAMGLSAFVEGVAAPLLRRAGEEWHQGRLTPAQEHLLSSVLHDIIVGAMRAFTARDGAPCVVVGTMSGERHVIGAALAAAVAAVGGWRVVYLGADLPPGEIAAAARSAGASAVAVSIVYAPDRQRVLAELRALRGQLPSGTVLIAGGSGAEAIAAELPPIGVRQVSSVASWLSELRGVGAAS